MDQNEIARLAEVVTSAVNGSYKNVELKTPEGTKTEKCHRLFNQPMPADDECEASAFIAALAMQKGEVVAWRVIQTGIDLYFREKWKDVAKAGQKVTDARINAYMADSAHFLEIAQRAAKGESLDAIKADVRTRLAVGAAPTADRDCSESAYTSATTAIAGKWDRIITSAAKRDSARLGTTG
jgi:hypothetical protein